MRCALPLVLCAFGAHATAVHGQSTGIQPVRVAAGTVLTFYSQTRLNRGAGNVLDALPKGTILRVKVLESIDSSMDRDGLEFRGTLVAPLTSGNEVLVRSDAEVRGLLVVLAANQGNQLIQLGIQNSGCGPEKIEKNCWVDSVRSRK